MATSTGDDCQNDFTGPKTMPKTIPGTGFGSSKINSNKVFRAFCLIVWILLWSYLVQGVQKAVQNRKFGKTVGRQAMEEF
jgi:hypothetical protein